MPWFLLSIRARTPAPRAGSRPGSFSVSIVAGFAPNKYCDRPPAAPRYLTKSRFILARECATRLFYTGKAEYADRKKEDPFLSALAEGGFQVGEPAKLYFPGGHEIETLNHRRALLKYCELDTLAMVMLWEYWVVELMQG